MILYSVVARSLDGIILAEATTAGVEGNHAQVTNQLIRALVNDPSLLPAIGNRKTFATDTNNTNSSATPATHLKATSKKKLNSRSKSLRGNKFASNRGLFASASSWLSGNSEDNGGEDSSRYYRDGDADASTTAGSQWDNSTEEDQSEGGGMMAMAPTGWTTSTSTSLETYFHVLRGEDILVIGLSDDLDGQERRANYGFLINVQKEFTLHYTPTKIQNANAYAYDKTFRKTLKNLMHHCNTTKHSQSYSGDTQAMALQSDVENIKNTIDMNIDLLMRRGVQLEDLIEQSDDLLIESQAFNKKSNKLKRVMRRKVWRYKMILIGFAVLTLYLMMAKMCGFDLSCEARDDDDNNNNNNNDNNNDKGYYNNDDGADNNNGGYYKNNGDDNNNNEND